VKQYEVVYMGKGIPDSFDIDADVNAVVQSTSGIDADVAMDSRMAVDTTMRLPDPIRAEVSVAPLRTEMDTVSRLAITEPIRTEMQMDVKPVVLDLCINLGINKLPRTNIKRPYHHCLAVSVLGTELASVSLRGHRDIIVDEPDIRPAVAWGSDGAVRNPRPPAQHRADPPEPKVVGPDGPHGGLRIRLGD